MKMAPETYEQLLQNYTELSMKLANLKNASKENTGVRNITGYVAVETRLNAIKEVLLNATVVKRLDDGIRVNINDEVVLEMDGENYTYTLTDVLDRVEGCITLSSPIGQAIYLKTVGEIVTCTTPIGKMNIKIVDIKQSKKLER